MEFFGIREFAALPAIRAIAGEKAVAVALSGGPDSMALLWLLSQWAAKGGGPVIHALTVDHGLRKESAAEAKQVHAWVKGWPMVKHNIIALSPGRSGAGSRVMEKARHARYEKMTAYCKSKQIRCLLLAHHRDDQAETFLFRLAKGSGLDGLAAMRAFQPCGEDIILVRPFLDVPKDRLAGACKKNKIPFVSDPTNDNPAYARPRLRQARQALEAEGLTAQRLAVTAARMARARDALEHYADHVFHEALKEKSGAALVFDLARMEQAPEDIRLRILLAAVRMLVPQKGYGVRLERMEALALDLFASGSFRRRTLGGVIFSRMKGEIRLERERG